MKYREIIPLKQKPDFNLTLPGSKSITNRVFLCATLAKGKSRIYGALKSDDAEVMISALKKVGISIQEKKGCIEIRGGGLNNKKATLDLHNAGTATRFLTAAMVLRGAETVITGCKRMQERPIGDLVDGLRQLGADIEYIKKEDFPPIKIKGRKSYNVNRKSYVVRINGDKSSQYFTALLMLAPTLDKPVIIEVIGDLVSKPYIDITIDVLKKFGIKIKNNNYKSFHIKPQAYKIGDYVVEGDASGASYWTSIAHLHGGKVKFMNLSKKSVQGDIKYEEVFKNVKNEKLINSVINMSAMPDAAMTLAVSASFFKGQTKIIGLSTLRIKETDRLAALENELKKIGVSVKTTKNSITIQGHRKRNTEHSGGKLFPVSCVLCPIKTYDDHRMAMCFAVVGTMIPGIVIEDPDCTDKTYPTFWEDLERSYLSPIKLGKRNLVLTGMRASGKSYLGKRIAKHLKRTFVDLDKEIEKSEKMTITEIVKSKGWEYFRSVEQKMCSRYKAEESLVIATGGGVILDEKNMKALKKGGMNILIFSDISSLKERLSKKTDRPSLKGQRKAHEELVEVWNERRDLYLKYADITWDNTSGEIVKNNLENLFIKK